MYDYADERAQQAQSEDVPAAAFHSNARTLIPRTTKKGRPVNAPFPLAREVRAIRRASRHSTGELAPGGASRGWVSFIYSWGELPEERTAGGGRAGSQRCARGVLPSFDGRPAAAARYVVPDAFGINCYGGGACHGCSFRCERCACTIRRRGMSGELPWLVLKPRGGQTCDTDGRASMGLRGRRAHRERIGLGNSVTSCVRRLRWAFGAVSLSEGAVTGEEFSCTVSRHRGCDCIVREDEAVDSALDYDHDNIMERGGVTLRSVRRQEQSSTDALPIYITV
ncbi:hypothetical protein BC826DRAFT_969236 [Russula brevipes]|nr:hypothetical protein BC826DRAFT_969236 [Russula brevipes]